MTNSKSSCRKEQVREAILAQLDAIKSRATGKNVSFKNEQHAQTVSLGGGTTTATTATTTLPVVSAPPPLLSPNTRRLPPIFAENRQNVAAIRNVCTGLHETLEQLHLDFAHGGGDRRRSSVNFLDSSGRSSSLSLQQLAKRGALTKELTHAARNHNRRNTEVKMQEMDEMQQMEEIRRVRVIAADEGLSDEQSVSDYAAEPELPRFSPGGRLRDEIEAMEESLQKISDGIVEMTNVDERDAGNPWWDSAMMTREMKAHTIRVNYHARRVLKWNQRAREHFLALAVGTNGQSEKCLADLMYLREQHALFQQRIEQCHRMQVDIAAEMAMLQETLREGNLVKSKLQQKLVQKAHEKELLPCDCNDAQRAELLLLLDHVVWPAVLRPDLDRVKAWICENVIQLDV